LARFPSRPTRCLSSHTDDQYSLSNTTIGMLRVDKGHMRYIRVCRCRSHTLSFDQHLNRRTCELPLLKATPTSWAVSDVITDVILVRQTVKQPPLPLFPTSSYPPDLSFPDSLSPFMSYHGFPTLSIHLHPLAAAPTLLSKKPSPSCSLLWPAFQSPAPRLRSIPFPSRYTTASRLSSYQRISL
jgi:hypothetical protein